jgi:hypothetical protein
MPTEVGEDSCLQAVEDCFQRSVLEIGDNDEDIRYLKVMTGSAPAVARSMIDCLFLRFFFFHQSFCEIVRSYIVAPFDSPSIFECENDWFDNYRSRRKCMKETWKLRGGIYNSDHVRECFHWKERKERKEFYRRLSSVLEHTKEGHCVLSQLEDEEKRELRCSWIVRWAKKSTESRSVLVGKWIFSP